MKDMKYGIVIETGERNCSAYVPDLPGCVATGATVEETRARIRKAIQMHMEGMREDAEEIPVPSTVCDSVEVA